MIVIANKTEKAILEGLRTLKNVSNISEYLEKIKDLQKQVSDLEIKESKIKEEHEKKDRELLHKIGLEKRRQAAESELAKKETEQAKREATITVKQANLDADQKRFEQNLKFNTERFEKMETYLKDMMKNILDRLPNVNLEINKKGR